MCSLVGGLLLVACGGSDGGIGTSPGEGTRTLLVDGTVELEDGAAHLRVEVQRAGVDVDDAIVTVESSTGDATLTLEGSGVYRTTLPGWAEGYTIEVVAGDDHLWGSIAAPERPLITSPVEAFDPQAEEDGLVTILYDGEWADTVRFKSKDFEYGPVEDRGEIEVPAVEFTETVQEFEIDRTNRVDLAGGAPGSELSAHCDSKTDLLIVNPFPG
jgi:hypothetical protein